MNDSLHLLLLSEVYAYGTDISVPSVEYSWYSTLPGCKSAMRRLEISEETDSKK